MNPATLDGQLQRCLKALYLPAVRACYREQAELARQETLSYERYLLEVLEQERHTRQHNRIARLLRESKLPLENNLESFDAKRLPRKVDAQVSVLLEGEVTRRRCPGLRQSGHGQNASTVCPGPGIGVTGAAGDLLQCPSPGAGTAHRQARADTDPGIEALVPL